MNAAVYEIHSSSRSPIVLEPKCAVVHASQSATNPSSQPPQSALPINLSKTAKKNERVEKDMRFLLDNSRELVAIGLNNTCALYQVERSLGKAIQQENGKYLF